MMFIMKNVTVSFSERASQKMQLQLAAGVCSEAFSEGSESV